MILDLLSDREDQGWQLTEKMKMDRATAAIPIIVCSAAIRLLEELQGRLKEKSEGIVPKPFAIDDLLRAIDEAWESGGAEPRAGVLNEPSARS